MNIVSECTSPIQSSSLALAERTHSTRWFQRDLAQEWSSCACIDLTLGTNRRTPLFDLIERDGSDAASIECRKTGYFSRRVMQVNKLILES